MTDARSPLSQDAPPSRRDAAVGLILELRSIPLFKGLGADELAVVAAIATHVGFADGEVIFEEGGDGDRLYVISSGEVEIVRENEQLAVLRRGECFGEMALFERARRSATARACADTKLLTLAREDFHDLLDVYPLIARVIAKVLAERLREALERRETS